MRPAQYILTPAAVHHYATALVQRHLQLRDHGPKCSASGVLTLLFTAAAWVTSLSETCRRLRGAPSDEAVRRALLATLPQYAALQRCLNTALASTLPKAVRQHRQPLALDLVLIPYHGQPQREGSEVYRSQPKQGTTHFHAYATVYLVRKGRRFTVALTPVAKGEALKAVLQRLLRQAARVGVRPCYLLLDRGFYSVAVIRYLQAAHYPFLLPVVGRGRNATHPHGPSGSRRFWSWTRSGWSTYTLHTVQHRWATVQICVTCCNYRGQWGRYGRRPLVYAYWGLRPSSPQWVREIYRRRFAIETTYRQLHQARIRTSTRNPLLRLLYVGLALILRNVWVWLHLRVLAKRRPGGRHIDLALLRFRTMLWWLGQLALTLFGGREVIETEYSIDTIS
jgi:Transposase DDE domain